MGVNDIMMAVQYRCLVIGCVRECSSVVGVLLESLQFPALLSRPLHCRYEDQAPLNVPVVAFEGGRDFTIPRGFMAQWRRYTCGQYRHVTLPAGDHYFVSTHFKEVSGDWTVLMTHGRPSLHPCTHL